MCDFLLVLLLLLPLKGEILKWEQLIESMASEEFRERQKASDTIAGWAAKNREVALTQLPQHISTTTDPESRRRLIGIAREIYLPTSRALFGFQYLSRRTATPMGNTFTTLLVQFVSQPTAASEAGLLRNDLIIAIDGQPLNPKFNNDDLMDFFAKRSRQKPTTFRIQRGEKEFDLAITPNEHEVTPLEKKAYEERFNRWLGDALDHLKAGDR